MEYSKIYIDSDNTRVPLLFSTYYWEFTNRYQDFCLIFSRKRLIESVGQIQLSNVWMCFTVRLSSLA